MNSKIPNIEELRKRNYEELLDAAEQKKLDSRKKIYRMVKRFLDILISAVMLVIFSPVWLVIVLLVRIDSRGKALFAHTRVGKDGKLFTIYKFRTMRMDAKDQDFAPHAPDDPRVTKLGRFLRRTSLDEVPQFWNVIRGHMALIGPRPEMPFIVETYTRVQRARLLVKPGITGLWQIAGRKDLPLHENVEFDLHYILNESPLLDLLILLKTFSVVLKGKGAY
ncbi:MAG TPA: sugar transferase [Candidatus Gracilibacteria bacterium]|nr:sugar transferase [Candidatus Gracilibacteria bacterium]